MLVFLVSVLFWNRLFRVKVVSNRVCWVWVCGFKRYWDKGNIVVLVVFEFLIFMLLRSIFSSFVVVFLYWWDFRRLRRVFMVSFLVIDLVLVLLLFFNISRVLSVLIIVFLDVECSSFMRIVIGIFR